MELKEKISDYLIYINGEFENRVPIDEADSVIAEIERRLVNDGYKRVWSSTNGADGTVYMNKEKYALAVIQTKRSLGVHDANGKEIFSGDIVEKKDGFGAYGEAAQMYDSDELYFYDRNSQHRSWDRLPRVKFEGPDVVKISDVIFKENFK